MSKIRTSLLGRIKICVLSLLILITLSSYLYEILTYTVIGISDGDTITVLIEKNSQKVRLNGIDCPEKAQSFGTKAKDFTSNLCFGKAVHLVTYGQDKYGRTIADVYLPDGKLLNQELVKAGLAWHYKKYSSDTTLATLELKARNSKIGLWIDSLPIAPWEFRKLK